VHFITNAWLARPESRASSSKGRRATRGQVPKLRGGACLMPSCIRYLWMVYAKLGEISTHDPIASHAFRIRQKWKTLDPHPRSCYSSCKCICTLAMDDGACCTRRITSIAKCQLPTSSVAQRELALHVHGTEPLVVVHFHQNRRETTKANWSQLESEFAETFLHRALLTAGGSR
jgi:hypothetical protein